MKGAWGPFKPPSGSVFRGSLLRFHCATCRRRLSAPVQWASYGAVRYLQTTAKHPIGAGFSYKISAAFTGKGNAFNRQNQYYTFDSDTGQGRFADEALTQKRRKIPSGQDSFFAGSIGDSSAAAFGVADGVGGYSDVGVDSADFAHGICRHMRAIADEFGMDKSAQRRLDPQQLLEDGYVRLCHDETVKGGGSTACIAVADPDGILSVANLGDSGFAQLRSNAVQYYSPAQTHAFNTPFQLSTIPPKALEQMQKYGGGLPLQDMPKDADVTSHALRHGDVLVFGTDGLWDNLSPQDVLDRVSAVMMESGAWNLPEGQGVQTSKALPFLTDEALVARESAGGLPLQTTLALDITTKAKEASINLKRDGPFAKAVQQAYPREHWHGGKPDDICVLVAIVIDQDAA